MKISKYFYTDAYFSINMPQSKFFLRKSSSNSSKLRDQKRKKSAKITPVAKQFKKAAKEEEEILSSDEIPSGEEAESPDAYSSDEETEQEKKLRLAKKYISQLEAEERAKEDDDVDTRDAVSRRLKDEALEEQGRLEKKRAHEYELASPEVHCLLRGHKLSVTCVVVANSEKYLISASKDCSIIKWCLESKKKLATIHRCKKGAEKQNGHIGEILSLAISSDDKFLASGCRNKVIKIWNPETMKPLKTFYGHKNAITALVFQRNSHNLMSASSDRSLKLWSLDEMGYVETLFGHQDSVTSMDCFRGEVALTSGGRDSTCRVWKIAEESQLVFQANGSSLDCVCVSSYQSFVSGGDDGHLLLWGTQKKKPMSRIALSHGLDPETEQGNWVVALTALRNTDLLASGSKDGFIRLWKREDETHSLQPVATVPLAGFVNSLQFSKSGDYLAAGVGQEHKLGRWWKLDEAKNSVVVFKWSNGGL